MSTESILALMENEKLNLTMQLERLKKAHAELVLSPKKHSKPTLRVLGTHRMSAEGRAAISAAAKKRWAKYRRSHSK